MSEKLELYKCNICGNLIEIVCAGTGQLVCCNQPMEKMQAHTESEEMVAEKHVPIIEKQEDGLTVRVGSIPHPMEETHYIEFIEAISNDNKYLKRKYLFPNEEPVLKLKCSCENVSARELCNIHGLWISKDWSVDNDQRKDESSN